MKDARFVNYCKKELNKRIERNKEEIKKLRKVLRLAEKIDKPEYKVYIHSYWRNEGEKDIEFTGTGTCREVLTEAEKNS